MAGRARPRPWAARLRPRSSRLIFYQSSAPTLRYGPCDRRNPCAAQTFAGTDSHGRMDQPKTTFTDQRLTHSKRLRAGLPQTPAGGIASRTRRTGRLAGNALALDTVALDTAAPKRSTLIRSPRHGRPRYGRPRCGCPRCVSLGYAAAGHFAAHRPAPIMLSVDRSAPLPAAESLRRCFRASPIQSGDELTRKRHRQDCRRPPDLSHAEVGRRSFPGRGRHPGPPNSELDAGGFRRASASPHHAVRRPIRTPSRRRELAQRLPREHDPERRRADV
jgi:hypothetical protein